MATITIQINTGQGTVGRTKTISGPHLVRFLSAYRGLLGQIPAGPANPDTGVVPMRDMTDEETILTWADGLLAGSKANVLRYEQTVAAQAASSGVTEVVLT